jgi:MshEN domain
MRHLEKLTRKKLGEILLDEGLVSKTQLADAERHREKTGEPLGFVLVDCNYLPEEDLAKTVALQYQLPYLELSVIQMNKELETLLPMSELLTRRLLPIEKFGSVLTLVVAEMPELAVLEELHSRTGLTPFLYVAMLSDLDRRLQSLAESVGNAKKPADAVSVMRPEDEIAAALNNVLGADDPGEDEEYTGDGGTITIEAPEGMEGDWENLFDDANEEVLKDLGD